MIFFIVYMIVVVPLIVGLCVFADRGEENLMPPTDPEPWAGSEGWEQR